MSLLLCGKKSHGWAIRFLIAKNAKPVKFLALYAIWQFKLNGTVHGLGHAPNRGDQPGKVVGLE